MKTNWEQQSESITKGLGRKIRQLRTDKGITQGDLAELLTERTGKQFKVATVSRLEAGSRPTSLPEIFLLAEIFQVPPAFLLPPKSVEERILTPISLQLQIKEAQEKLAESDLRIAKLEHQLAKEAVDAARLLVDAQKRLIAPTKDEFLGAVLALVGFSEDCWGEDFDPRFLLEVFDIPSEESEEISELYLEKKNEPSANSTKNANTFFAAGFVGEAAKIWGFK